jgi:superfamily II RNA helicase
VSRFFNIKYPKTRMERCIMAKSKQERITGIEEQIAQLENQRKQLVQKQKEDERKERTRRLCKRHGLLEKYMPELAAISDEQFEMFIKRGINTSYGKKMLAEIIAKPQPAAPQEAKELPQAAPTGSASGSKPNSTGQAG